MVALCAFAVIAAVTWVVRPRGCSYEGRTVHSWFRQFAGTFESALTSFPGDERFESARKAFQGMGTNAVPFLASKINRDSELTLLERLATKLPKRFQPVPRKVEERCAALILSDVVQPPTNMLRELLQPALRSQDDRQRHFATWALEYASERNQPAQ